MGNLICLYVTLCCVHASIYNSTAENFGFIRDVSSMTTFIETDDFVNHMEMDLFVPGNFIFSDGWSLKTTDGTITKLIVGAPTSHGYSEAFGNTVRFSHITGFLQLDNESVLVIDSANHCVRHVDRRSRYSKSFAGICTRAGYGDGRLAQFHYPWKIIADKKKPQNVLITDPHNHALRHLDISSRVVSTFFTHQDFSPCGIVQSSGGSGDLYMTSGSAVYKLSYSHRTLTSLASSTSYRVYNEQSYIDPGTSYLQEMVLIGSGSKLVISGDHKLRVLDLQMNWTYSVCTGVEGVHDGTIKECMLAYPHALMVDGASLFIGEFRKIRRINGVSTRAATQMTSLKQTPTTATPGSIANACQPRCINGNITHLLQPGQRWARVEIGQGQVLRLSVGDSIYETSQGGRNCALHISVVIPDYRITRRMQFKAEYNIECKLLSDPLTRSTVMSLIEAHYNQIQVLCSPECGRPSGIDAQISCTKNSLHVTWPTNVTFSADVTQVPADLQRNITDRLQAHQASFLGIFLINRNPPVVYPTKTKDGMDVEIILTSSCNNLIYQEATDSCV